MFVYLSIYIYKYNIYIYKYIYTSSASGSSGYKLVPVGQVSQVGPKETVLHSRLRKNSAIKRKEYNRQETHEKEERDHMIKPNKNGTHN